MLQFITDGACVREIVEQTRRAVEGGCRWVQVRMKEAPDDEVRQVVEVLRPLCQRVGVTLVLDDRVALARELDVDGVHLGKEDMAPAEARRILGGRALIGATANTLDDVVRLAAQPIDYFGVGPFRFTTTKKRLAPTLGLEGYRTLLEGMRAKGVHLPVVAIGGITLDDVEPLLATGVTGIAISGAIAHAEAPDEAAKAFLEKLRK